MSSSKNDRSLSVKGVAPESSSLMVRVMSTPARQAGAKLPSMGRARVIFGSLG
jgi:hypothetical protein